jgi:hypothetical protein
MKLAFDQVKATQAAALFLKLAGGSLNYTALIKLLYKSDREALRRWGLPITTDKYVSMKLGPVTSNIYDLIKASANPNAHPTFWSTHIRKAEDPRYLVAVLDPGISELSPSEESLIQEMFSSDGGKDRFRLADECHRDFPEWRDPGQTSFPLDISEILAALTLTEDETSHVRSSIDAQKAARKLSV